MAKAKRASLQINGYYHDVNEGALWPCIIERVHQSGVIITLPEYGGDDRRNVSKKDVFVSVNFLVKRDIIKSE